MRPYSSSVNATNSYKQKWWVKIPYIYLNSFNSWEIASALFFCTFCALGEPGHKNSSEKYLEPAWNECLGIIFYLFYLFIVRNS